MIKKVIFVRHAKSDRSIIGLEDTDRPLNPRGYMDAHRIGKHLGNIIKAPMMFISSPAVRAISTALIIAREMKYSEEKISIHPRLYEAKIKDYESLIHSCDNEADTILLFGHNPTISEAVEWYSGKAIGELSTCSVAVLKFEAGSWGEVYSSLGVLENIYSPKLLID